WKEGQTPPKAWGKPPPPAPGEVLRAHTRRHFTEQVVAAFERAGKRGDAVAGHDRSLVAALAQAASDVDCWRAAEQVAPEGERRPAVGEELAVAHASLDTAGGAVLPLDEGLAKRLRASFKAGK